MSRFKEIFEAYGANYQQTLERFVGNEGMYLKFLDMMLYQDQTLGQLQQAIQNGELKKAFEAAHTLKGVVANMGLTPLYEAVCEIVEPLRKEEEREDYSELYQVIDTELQKVRILSDRLQEVKK